MAVDFIGNDQIRDKLRSLADMGRLHPCLLFEGPVGVGKGTTAQWLAQVVNCEEASNERPCGSCWSCRQIEKGQHPDILELHADESKTTRIISVKQARELIGQLSLQPFHARRRFVIIDPADAMTPEAASALLKTFEDPPKATSFILISSASASLLSTVRSRSQRIRFAPVDIEVLTDWLEKAGRDNAKELAHLSEGCPGRAHSLENDGADAWRTARDKLIEALDAEQAAQFKYAETLCRGDRAKWQVQVEQTLDAAACMLRDALAASSGGAIVYNTDRPDVVERWADTLGSQGVAGLAETVSDARDRLTRNVSGRLIMDAFVSRFSEAINKGLSRATV